ADLAVALEVTGVARLVHDVVQPEARGGPTRLGDAARVQIEAAQQPPRRDRRVVEREEAEAAADVEHRPLLRKILTDLVEEPLAQDAEACPAVRAHDGIVVGADDPLNGGRWRGCPAERRRCAWMR